jgi:hypothetical protein
MLRSPRTFNDITGLKVYLDGVNLQHNVTPTPDSWLLCFAYSHESDMTDNTLTGGLVKVASIRQGCNIEGACDARIGEALIAR